MAGRIDFLAHLVQMPKTLRNHELSVVFCGPVLSSLLLALTSSVKSFLFLWLIMEPSYFTQMWNSTRAKYTQTKSL